MAGAFLAAARRMNAIEVLKEDHDYVKKAYRRFEKMDHEDLEAVQAMVEQVCAANVDPILYSPFTYDAANLLIEAMKKANSSDPKKYLPELQKLSFTGASGPISFDDKGDRKDAEITMFTMKGGKLEPIAVVKGDKTMKYDDFIKGSK